MTGLDSAPTAIKKARAKAKRRRITADFVLGDALNLAFHRQFDTLIDSGLFHVFSDEERPRFRDGLERVLRPGGTYFMICFSEKEPGDWGPRRVTQAEIRSVFKDGWRTNYIQPSTIDVIGGHVEAWLASLVWSPRSDPVKGAIGRHQGADRPGGQPEQIGPNRGWRGTSPS